MRNMLIFLIVVVIVIAVGTYFYVISKHTPAPATQPATNSLAPTTPGQPK